MMKKQEGDENQALLNNKKSSHDTDDQHQRHSSRLEWAESSWTRLLHIFCCWWIDPILSLAHKGQLTENDLDHTSHVDKSSILLDRLHSYDWSSTTTWIIVSKEFWKDYIFASLYIFPFLIVRISQSLLLRQIILDMMDKQKLSTFTYACTISLILCVFIQPIMNRQATFQLVRVGMRVRNALIMIIYTRSLSLKSASWQQMNTGQIINLIAKDVSKFEEVCANLAFLWGGLLETIIIFALLCWMIKPIPTLCCFILFSLFILTQLYTSRKFDQHHEIIATWSDKRVQAFSEFIHGCHVIKMYNWEKPMEDRIAGMRGKELASIRDTSRFRALNMTQAFISVPALALATFGSAWLLGYPLNVANTFPVLILFALMRSGVMVHFPLVMERLSEARSASKRIDAFIRLGIEQQYQSSLSVSSIDQQQKGRIILSNASFSWHNETLCLSSLNLIIEQGTFVGIVGPVGSGKSSLLTAILGEMNRINGELNTNDSSFSYAAQTPWIFSDTFRNNILFNRPFDEQRYRNIIHACCLDVDLSLFGASGDLTVIGEKGVNLSGGQKARVALARALYTDADIYLLDDPLSAVDRTVATHIYERCIGPDGLLKNKTRLLVTHQTQFLYAAHQIIFLSYGHIDEQGRLDENITKEDDDAKKSEPSILSDMLDENTPIVDTQSIVADETTFNDGAKWSVLYNLFTAPPSGILGFCLLIVLLLLGEILNDGTNYWLSICLKQSRTDQQVPSTFAYIYFGLIMGTIFADLMRTNYLFTIILHGSNNLHNNMLKRLLYTSIQFFESNPSGRILSRVSKDQHVVDEVLPAILLGGIKAVLLTIGSLVIICLADPIHLLSFIVVVPILWWVIRYYQKPYYQLKRLESITRSSVYALLSSSMTGLTTIRAFKAEKNFIQLIYDRIDMNTSAYINIQGTVHWLSVRFSTAWWLILVSTCIRIVFFRNSMTLPIAALSLLSALHIQAAVSIAFRRLSEADILMTSVERIDEYTHLPHEDDNDGDKRLVKTSPEWPADGTIEFRNYSLRHRSNLDYAIRNINLYIESGQKIGIIGRTGAGKSSLFKGMFRFIDRSCVTGEILIDDVDISRITRGYLRSHLSVIPQQPVLFSGTLRYNLDPFKHYSDEQCWLALEDVQLKQFVNKHPAGLLMSIAESGNNLSVGQCQLICIARAILKKSKILLIDEATANVDQVTDDLIQAVISNKFQDRTVMTIAHRLSTVTKSDRILVLDKGIIVNYDTPLNILRG